MLIEKNTIEQGDIVTIKLVGGEEIICKFVLQESGVWPQSYESDIKVSKPLLVVMAQQGFGLMPYILTGNPDKDLYINRNQTIYITKTIDAVAKEYIKQTTGIIPVSSLN